ncbi:early boundary activity protein 2-like [Zerene cesonia]|uniref:early boundary activity protein 2-like n=1 Tax=Zerene cesonia TaxID=33412 RepID=UPI0018E54BB5|nr:early boundary activity protein 2-like [Zerene cesonia]
MAQYVRHLAKIRNSKKVLTPIHRPNAVVNILQERQMNGNHSNKGRKRKYKEMEEEVKKSLPDSTRKNMSTRPNINKGTVKVQLRNIIEINATFQQLFTMLNALRPSQQVNKTFLNEVNKLNEKTFDEPEESDRSESEESNRSDDNVLISNKYIKARSNSVSPRAQENSKDEWIPIGSGKTLIHKDKYRKVNWKSYTIATRTLLLATFPRRILATHSLTGKRSPAFQNKPAKMCLDPKIVSDVIIEITSRFKVKENLVRSIITTKCADECKMYKMRLKTKSRQKDKSSNESSTDQENVPKNDSITVK